MAKEQSNFRLSDVTRALLDALSAKLGFDKTTVVELAVRDMAKREGLWPNFDASMSPSAEVLK